MVFPKTIVYNDANKPDWMTVIKEDEGAGFTFELVIEAQNKLRFNTTNIAGILVDLQKALVDTGLTVGDINTIISFLRFSTNKIALTVAGTGTDVYEIVLPIGLSISEIRKATGEIVPFSINMDRNSVIFAVTFSSEVTLELLLKNVNTMISSSLMNILQMALIINVFSYIYNVVVNLPKEVGLA